MRILLTGISTRAIAESALRGGYQVITLDYFGDRDQKELVENYSLMRDFRSSFSASGLLEASRQLSFEAVAYISSLENHPEVVAELAQGHRLLGNTPQTLREVRHWPTLRSFCHEAGIPFPATLFAGESLPTGGRWLRKPVRSGGGHGISFWRGEPLDEHHLLQEHLEGTHCSAAFVANGQDCVLIGVAEQLIGREELGATGFTWCGNILPLDLPVALTPDLSPTGKGELLESLLDRLEGMARVLTRRFGLRGVNGFDFVLAGRGDQCLPYLVEVNPRYTASMELMDWAYGLSVFDLHVRSCEGDLPSFSLRERIHQPGFYGRGIVYARQDATMPETAGWKALGRRDIPFPGEKIGAGRPICTVLVRAESRDECWRGLVAGADAVWQEVARSGPRHNEGEAYA